MEYQFSFFDQWITKLQYDPQLLPALDEWEKQLFRKKQEILKHFKTIGTTIQDEISLKLYITHHYRSLNHLIQELLYIREIHTALLLKTLEQLKFMLELHYRDLISATEDHPVYSYLSVEECALLVNTLIECGALKVRSKKDLARQITKHILFVGHEQRHAAAESFYNALFSTKSTTIATAGKLLTRMQAYLSKTSRLNTELS